MIRTQPISHLKLFLLYPQTNNNIFFFELSDLNSTTHITIPWLPCGRACVAGGEDGMEFSNVRIAAVLTDLHMMMLHIAPSVVR